MRKLNNSTILVALLILLSSAPGGSQPPGQAQEPGKGSAAHIDLALLQEPPADLSASDFEVLLGESLFEVEALDRSPDRRLLIYFDMPLSSGRGVQRAAAMLAAEASRLTGLGEVEIVRAAPWPERILAPSRDATAVEAALGQAALGGDERDVLREVRRRNFAQLRPLLPTAGASPDTTGLRGALERAVDEEARLLLRQQDFLLSYLAGEALDSQALEGQALEGRARGRRQGLVFWITDGFDLDPYAFYLASLGEPAGGSFRSSLPASPMPASVEDLGRALASLGWAPVAVGPGADPEAAEEGLSDYERFKDSAGSGGAPNPAQGQGAFISTTLEGIRRKLQKGNDPSAPVPSGPILLSPRAPLELLAGSTAGAVVEGASSLSSFLDSLSRRYVLQVAVPPGESHEIAVRSRRAGLRIRTPVWAGTSLPTAVSAARARRLLAGDLEGGVLDLAAALRREPDSAARASLEARADLGLRPEARNPAAPGAEVPARLRITVAPGDRQGPSSLSHTYRTVEHPRDPWSYETALSLPEDADRVALLVEDLETGAWGGTLAAVVGQVSTVPQAAGASSLERALAEAEFLPKPRALRLERPEGEVFQGRMSFKARALSQDVARVVFFLDGEEVAEKDRPPYEARVRLGRLPEPRTLRAVAYGADGRELGEDTLFLNEAGGNFRVRIVSPRGEATGAVDVEVSASLPQGRRLDRMEFSLNERTVATLYGPPYRQRMVVPAAQPAGFIRVVAYLDDGRFAEDVVFLDDQDFTDRVQVRLVELYTVVTDRQGKPVKGLSQDRFSILEEGTPREIAQFSDAGDLPVTLGLNIDSSASMFVKLPVVQEAASDFVSGFLSGRDRAFLVDFDTRPRMALDITGDLQSVIHGIHRLQPGGDTHLWESIVFSLVELQGVTGKKALVVFSDGAEEEEALSFKVCHEFAQRLGVPIYLVVLHPGIARGDDLTSSMKSFTRKLERLTEDTGGRVYYLANTQNLDAIYREIDDELRSQYLLAYYAETGEDEIWRPVKVEVKGRGLEARTISGYYPHF